MSLLASDIHSRLMWFGGVTHPLSRTYALTFATLALHFDGDPLLNLGPEISMYSSQGNVILLGNFNT